MGPVVELRMVERRLSSRGKWSVTLAGKGGCGEITPCMLGIMFR